MRVTLHSGRKGKNGRFNPNHCDRNFNLDSEYAGHISKSLTPKNVYYLFDMRIGSIRKKRRDETFEQWERDFYQQKFSAIVEKTNQKYIQQRHRDKCRTVSDLYESPKTCPEETLFTIGNSVEGAPPAKIIHQIMREQVEWEAEQFPQVQVLNIAFHLDEPEANPHFHIRRTYLADKEGLPSCNQNECLKQMGIPLPNPDKPESRTNNRKITHTKLCREHLIELCEKYGIDIERDPKKRRSVSLAFLKQMTAEKENVLINLEPLVKAISDHVEIIMGRTEERIDQLVKDAETRFKRSTTEAGTFNAYLREKGLEEDFKAFREQYTASSKERLLEAMKEELSLPEEIEESVRKLFF